MVLGGFRCFWVVLGRSMFKYLRNSQERGESYGDMQRLDIKESRADVPKEYVTYAPRTEEFWCIKK